MVQGINDSEEEMQALKKVIAEISPEKIQLNTSVRIPAEEYSLTVPRERMEKLAEILGEQAEVISDFDKAEIEEQKAGREEILAYLARRPGTLKDIAQGLGIHPDQVMKYINQLLAQKKISARNWQGKIEYFVPTK